ncbi:MAG: hypothetical protein WCK00_05385 [Deltaproteobacteria bacterium]
MARLLLLICLVASLYVPLALYVRDNYPNFGTIDYPLWEHAFAFARNASGDNPDVVFLGDSRVLAGVYPRAISPSAISLSLTATAPFANYFLLRTYLRNHRPPQVVVVAFAPENLYQASMDPGIVYWNLDILEGIDVLSTSVRLKDKPWRYPNGRQVSVWGICKDFCDLFLYKGFYLPYYPGFFANEIDRCKQFNEMHLKGQRESRGFILFGTANGCTNLNRAAGENETRYSPLVLHYVDATLALCKLKNIPVIFTTMPFSESSYSHLSANYVKEYAKVTQALKDKYPAFEIHTKINVLPDQYFGDPSHVNFEGTKVVTSGLRELLVQRGYIGHSKK